MISIAANTPATSNAGATAGKQFRRVNGYLHLPSLRASLKREIAEPAGPDVHNDQVEVSAA